MNRLIDNALCFLFPRRCRFCGVVIDLREKECESCRNSDCRIEGEICLRCGCRKADCVCRGKKAFYEGVAAPFYYQGAAEKAILRMKFGKRPEVADVLGDEMAACFTERLSDRSFDLCAFVPDTKKARKERGFNQSELLARRVADGVKLPLHGLLQKDYETAQQHLLPRLQRSGNLLGVFSVVETERTALQGARVLLVDDIKTSGATLNECAKTLLIGGAAEVFCLTAAIAKPHRGHDDPEFPEREAQS